MRRLFAFVLSFALAISAVVALARPGAGASRAAGCPGTALAFREPLRLGEGRGYEPGIDVDSAGTIFVTAHKLSVVAEGTRTASWLWRSTDNGLSFQEMSGLNGETEENYAFEGDLAVDAKDRLYFADTWAADNHFYRYSDHGATLDFYRPAVPTYEVDDRPWLASHGDGFVYYLSNTGYKTDGRLTVHVSTDAGETFDPIGYTFPQSGWGFIDADPNSSYVYAFMNDLFYGTGTLGDATELFTWVSPDHGQTWRKHHVADYEFGYQITNDGHDDAFPAVAVSPKDGSVAAVWTDDGRKLKIARSTDHGTTWTVSDVTPFSGVYSFSWIDVSPTGDIGIVFQANPNAVPDVEGKNNFIYAMVLRPSAKTGVPTGSDARIRPASTGEYDSQADFFQVAFTPNGALNVAFTDGTSNPTWQMFYTQQTRGPNLGGKFGCGISGTP